jgi:hypothetical protein
LSARGRVIEDEGEDVRVACEVKRCGFDRGSGVEQSLEMISLGHKPEGTTIARQTELARRYNEFRERVERKVGNGR